MNGIERIHLDLVGGLSGDMFAAALADAFPEAAPGLLAEIAKLALPGTDAARFVAHSDGVIQGRRFVVGAAARAVEPHRHGQGDAPAHGHVPHREVRRRLREAHLDPGVLRHAEALFDRLAAAEAEVHGIAKEDVEFHEVGAWDSIADFVAAAYFVARLAPRRWTWSPPPLGGGRVKTAHGWLPVPAPATARLLHGMEVIDDGIAGERVTPTGAAILRHLESCCAPDGASPSSAKSVLVACGNGHGTRTLPGIPNIVRCLAFARSGALPDTTGDEIAALQFEIDDQAAEDLAVALDRIRASTGVLEVYQAAVYGKKGRLATQVQVLARIPEAERIAQLCLAETSTLGLRIARVARRVLARAEVEAIAGEGVRVKVAARPSGELTSKAEIDDLARIEGGRGAREDARRRAERRAIDIVTGHGERNREDD